jgi:ABC-type iron transport system FetAB ATPase subunit
MTLAPKEMKSVGRTDWEERPKNILRAEMARKGITYAQLIEKLAEKGIEDNERNLPNKVSRRKFTAGFLLQCLSALGCTSLRLD